jgi:hypothetical protein
MIEFNLKKFLEKNFDFIYVSKKSKAQNVIELTILVAVSMIALMFIFVVYSGQFGSLIHFNDYHTMRTSVNGVIDFSNSVYYSGAGSEAKIFLDVSNSIDVSKSGINGKVVYLRILRGGDILDVADVNIIGDWLEGAQYYSIINKEGNIFLKNVRGYEIIGSTMFVEASSPDDVSVEFVLKNIFDKTLNFDLNIDGGNRGGVVVWFDVDGSNLRTQSFSLSPDEEKNIKLNWTIPSGYEYNELQTRWIEINLSGEDYSWNELVFTSLEFIE